MYYIITSSGKKLDYMSPSVGSICIHDVATALSRLPRFCGHTRSFYSVAQHSINVALIARAIADNAESESLNAAHKRRFCTEMCYEGLMHDAHEAYVGDVPTPLKRALDLTGDDSYSSIQQSLDKAVRSAFKMQAMQPAVVGLADRVALLLEATSPNGNRDVRRFSNRREWKRCAQIALSLPCYIRRYVNIPLGQDAAFRHFISLFKALSRELGISRKSPAFKLKARPKTAPRQSRQLTRLATNQ